MTAVPSAVVPEVGSAIVTVGAPRYCDPVAFISIEVIIPKPFTTATPSAVTPPGPVGAVIEIEGGFELV